MGAPIKEGGVEFDQRNPHGMFMLNHFMVGSTLFLKRISVINSHFLGLIGF